MVFPLWQDQSSNHIKQLGITILDKLKWRTFVSNICSKMRQFGEPAIYALGPKSGKKNVPVNPGKPNFSIYKMDLLTCLTRFRNRQGPHE